MCKKMEKALARTNLFLIFASESSSVRRNNIYNNLLNSLLNYGRRKQATATRSKD